MVAVDWLDEAARWTLTQDIGEQVNLPGDQVLTNIIAVMPSSPVSTSFDVGSEAYPYVLDSSSYANQTLLAECKKLADSERGQIYLTAPGAFTYETRHRRMLHATIDWTLTDNDLQGLSLPSTRDEIINSVRVTIHPRIVDEDPTTIVYSQANVIDVLGSSSKTLLGPFRDQVTGDPMGATDVQTLVATTDYTANTAADGSGTDITSDFSFVVTTGSSGVKFVVSNANSATGYLTFLQFRGRGIRDKGTLQLSARDTGSITDVGERVVEFDMPYQSNVNVGQAAADYTLSKFSSQSAQARLVTVTGKSAALLTAILQRDISDRITLTETVTGLNGDFFVNGMTLRVLPTLQVSATLTLAPTNDPFTGLYWVIGTSALGTDTRLAPF